MNRRDFIKQAVVTGAATAVATQATGGTARAASDQVALGLIGCGARGQELLEAAQRVPGVQIAALSDCYTGRLERAKARTGGKAQIHANYKEVLARKDLDGVIVAAPDHWHKQMAIDAMESGKDVYVEKPMTYTVGEGLELMAAVKRTSRVLQVGSQGMSSATNQQAREFVKAGRLGKVTMIRASYNRNTAGGAWIYPIPPDANPSTVNWTEFLGSAPKRPFSLERFFRWRCYWDYSGGIAGDLFVHLLTTIHYVMDATVPATVFASGQLYRWKESREVPDTVNAVMTYREGFTVNMSSTFNNESAAESGFEILGTEGSIAFRGGRLAYTPENVRENNRWVVDSWPQALEDAYYADPKVQAAESPETWAPKTYPAGESFDEVGRDATITHVGRFVEAIRSRQAPNEPADRGHHAAAGAHMVNMSIRQQRSVEWDFDKDTVRVTS
jgi:predicted dehydrogenase